MIDPLFTFFGIKITHVGGGLAGGTMRYLFGGGNWKQAATFVTAGVLTSAWLTPGVYFLLVHYFPSFADPGIEGALGFLVGLTGMMICEGVMIWAQKWAKNPWVPSFLKPSTPPPTGNDKP